MSMTSTEIVERFHQEGFAAMAAFVDPATARSWAEIVGDSDHLRHIVTAEYDRVVDAGEGTNEHYSLDRFELDAAVPAIGAVYDRLFSEVVSLIHPYAIQSPYDRSRYYLKIYPAQSGAQGWHYDTNGYSGILYLSDNIADGVTEIIARSGEVVAVEPRAGTVLLLDGRRCWHRACTPMKGPKSTVLLNYYDAGHRERDPRTDPLLFGD